MNNQQSKNFFFLICQQTNKIARNCRTYFWNKNIQWNKLWYLTNFLLKGVHGFHTMIKMTKPLYKLSRAFQRLTWVRKNICSLSAKDWDLGKLVRICVSLYFRIKGKVEIALERTVVQIWIISIKSIRWSLISGYSWP